MPGKRHAVLIVRQNKTGSSVCRVGWGSRPRDFCACIIKERQLRLCRSQKDSDGVPCNVSEVSISASLRGSAEARRMQNGENGRKAEDCKDGEGGRRAILSDPPHPLVQLQVFLYRLIHLVPIDWGVSVYF